MTAAPGTRIALPVVQRLAVAYLDRVAGGDAPRAAIVLGKLAEVYPDLRNDLVREVSEIQPPPSGQVWDFPPRIHGTWGGDTQRIVAISLRLGTQSGTSVFAAADPLFDATYAQLPNVGRTFLNALPASAPVRSYISQVGTTSVSALPNALDALISGTIASSAVSTAPQTRDPVPLPAPPAPPRAITLPETRITASAAPTTVPTWGWYVLGGVVLLGAGTFVYVKWFAPKRVASS